MLMMITIICPLRIQSQPEHTMIPGSRVIFLKLRYSAYGLIVTQ